MTTPIDIPPPLPWDQRKPAVNSSPGGYSSYIRSLREICDQVVSNHLLRSDLVDWTQNHFQLSTSSANALVGFLHKTDVLESTVNRIHLSEYANRWYAQKDDGILLGMLHRRIQFVGEMLAELRGGPRSIKELHQAAQRYGLDWKGYGQVSRRRGWLESAGLIEPIAEGRLAITDAGHDLLSKLTLHSRSSPPVGGPSNIPVHHPPVPEPEEPAPPNNPSSAEALADEIRAAATDSKNPDRLEIAVRDAFRFLGFEAEKLGGAGKTDVLITAPLGKDSSYSAAIDAKAVGNGALGNGQVAWATLDYHRKHHKADYSMVVGPNPAQKSLMRYAADFTVAVLSTEQLADLCLQHDRAPLGLDTYRALFATGGAVNMAPIEQAARDLTRTRNLAVALCAELAEKTSQLGPLSAPVLMGMLYQSDKAYSEPEIQQVLDTLSSPLIGAIQGTADQGYVLATAPRVTQRRLQQLGDSLNP
ncbi:MAG: hypothetical protein OXF00_05855 [bacterium]|nr:hypothetical protein [bacterium]